MPTKSPAQKRLMEAAAHTPGGYGGVSQKVGKEFVGKDARPAAGVCITTPEGLALFLKRGPNSDHAGEWAFPGGGIENGETAEQAARRETFEEAGFTPEEGLAAIDQQENEQVHFTTFHQGVDEPFEPQLNPEHTEFVWSHLSHPPQPLHPGVAKTLEQYGPMKPVTGANDNALAFDRSFFNHQRYIADSFAFDRAPSARSYNDAGHLQLSTANITKANVCPYMGKEIPDFQSLGLDPNKVYWLYRDPEELKKAESTFNNLQILSEHVEVDALDHHPELTIGTTGSESQFEAPYMKNSLAFWVKDAIDDIENEEKEELSSAYRYRADMTPGTSPDGERYDGVMRDIIGNHVALVKEGRAGPDVVVGDSTEGLNHMGKIISQKAVMARGALAVFLQPRLAADAKMPSITSMLIGVNAKNFKDRKPFIIKAVEAGVKGKLAKDASTEGLGMLLDALEKSPVADNMEPDDDITLDAPDLEKKPPMDLEKRPPVEEPELVEDAPDPMEAVKSFLAGKLTPEDMAEVEKICAAGAQDEPVPFKGMPEKGGKKDDPATVPAKDEDKDKKEMVEKPAMDAAIAAATKKTEAAVVKRFRELDDAKRLVFPYVGEVNKAFDSAGDLLKEVLTGLKVDIDGVDASAYPKLLALVPKPGSKPERQSIAQDASSIADFDKRFPNASRIGSAA